MESAHAWPNCVLTQYEEMLVAITGVAVAKQSAASIPVLSLNAAPDAEMEAQGLCSFRTMCGVLWIECNTAARNDRVQDRDVE